MKLDFRVEIDEKTGVVKLAEKYFATAEHQLSRNGIENIKKLSIVLEKFFLVTQN